MFSDVGRTLDQDTIEYAWLIDVQLGRLSGKLSSPQLHSILTCLETLILLLADSENELNSPAEDVLLHEPQVAQSKSNTHQNFFPPLQQFLQNKTSGTNTAKNVSQNSSNATVQKNEKIAKNERKASETTTNTKEKKTNTASNNETDVSNIDCHKLKYRVSRLAVDAVDFWLVESGVALQLWVSPVRLATCNLHGKQVGSGLSCVIYSMSIRQSVWQSHKYTHAK